MEYYNYIMIYTISNKKLSIEDRQKRNYPNGCKFKTKDEERKDEELYHNKSIKRQKKGGALSSTLAVKDMSNALSKGAAEEPEYYEELEEETIDTYPYTELQKELYEYTKTPSSASEIRRIGTLLGIDISQFSNVQRLKPIVSKMLKEGSDKMRDEKYNRTQERIKMRNEGELSKKVNVKINEIIRLINWNLKKKLKYLSLSNANKRKLTDLIYLNGDDISMDFKFNKVLEKYNIEYVYDNSIVGQVNKLFDDPSNFEMRKFKDDKGNVVEKLMAIHDRGYFFEIIMITQHQDILKKCNSKSNQPDFLLSDDQPKLQGVRVFPSNPNSSLLSKFCLYDAFNKYLEIEFKFYDNDDDFADFQISKFIGNESFTPYFCEHDGKWVLYNLWCNDIDDWLNVKNFKQVIFCVYIKGEIYTWSLTDFVNSNDCNFKTMPSKIGPKGEKLYEIKFDISDKKKIGIFDINQTRKDDNDKIWLKIPLNSMVKLT